jgi:predicted ATP-grasp superfamily ATP-dependent carboligase
MRASVLIAGVSVRALAESAARAGADVIALDAYGDLDLRQIARVVPIPRAGDGSFDQMRAARASRGIDAGAVAYVSSFENAPNAVETLARGRALLGNSPAVRASPPLPSDATRWLLKPRRSGGGHGIVRWVPGMPVPRSSIVQERIRGSAASIIFAADGAHIVPLALTRQLSGDPAFGASGFAYCGSILEPHHPELFANASELAAMITREFSLRGVCGIDFIARGAIPYTIEVNPRPTASMELVERATGESIWLAHVAGCTAALSNLLHAAARAPSVTHGKAVLYARRPVVLGDTTRWLADDDVRDIPAPGERIARGSPICTIFASGRTSALCYAALVRRARIRFAEVEGRMRRKSA